MHSTDMETREVLGPVMTEMGFDVALMPLVRSGAKTLTYRLGDKFADLHLGDDFRAVCPGEEPVGLYVTQRWPGKFGHLPLDDPRHEPYSSLEHMRTVFEGYYGRPVQDDEFVVVLAFERSTA